MPLAVRRHQVVVVGGGIAACSAALELVSGPGTTPGAVTVLVDTEIASGSSPLAQGGLAAALASDDSVALHAQDTLRVSGGVGDVMAARSMTAAAPEVVAWLRQAGVHFDTDATGVLALGREAGHRRRRIVHANGDATGAEIMRALGGVLRSHPRIEVLEGVTVMDLLRDPFDERVVGVIALDAAGGLTLHLAPAVILGTGGYGHLFAATTNPPQVAGAALAMAIRAGVAVADVEMVQFHPTALAAAGQDPQPLLTEALRGEGAILVDEQGRRFMGKIHPDGELAPRDVVARAIYAQLATGHHVFLDATVAVGERFPERFPTVFALAAAAGIDPRSQRLPVSPAAHYCMGGVATDLAGRTSLPGLWVVGEAASSGVHGANRLASNSLLEGVVMGRAAARAVRAELGEGRPVPGPAERVIVARSALSCAPHDPDSLTRLRELLWRHAGVVRHGDGLRAGLGKLAETAASAAAGAAGPVARNAWVVAQAVLTAALARSESRGAHFRADHPDEDPAQAARRVVAPSAEPVMALEVRGDQARHAELSGTVAA